MKAPKLFLFVAALGCNRAPVSGSGAGNSSGNSRGSSPLVNGKDSNAGSEDQTGFVDDEGNVVETESVEAEPEAPGPLLCTKGPELTKNLRGFDQLFAVLCKNGDLSEFTKDLMKNAYKGGNDPRFKVIKNEVGELLVTRYSYAYAMRIPLNSPKNIIDYRLQNVISKGVYDPRNRGSKLAVKIESLKDFPGKGIVQSIIYRYSLSQSRGVAIYDERRIQQNSFLVKEGYKDLSMSVEYLLDADKNNYHLLSNSLIISIRADPYSSYFIYVSDLIIQNRIDPARVRDTLLDIARGAHALLWQTLRKPPPKN